MFELSNNKKNRFIYVQQVRAAIRDNVNIYIWILSHQKATESSWWWWQQQQKKTNETKRKWRSQIFQFKWTNNKMAIIDKTDIHFIHSFNSFIDCIWIFHFHRSIFLLTKVRHLSIIFKATPNNNKFKPKNIFFFVDVKQKQNKKRVSNAQNERRRRRRRKF